jgi:PST family polysaccharide transporter
MWWTVYRHVPRLRFRTLELDLSLARHFLHFGLAIGIMSLLSGLVTRLDSFLIGTFVGEAQLGFYDRAYRITEWPALLTSALLSRTALLTYARLQDDPVRLRKTISMVTWLSLSVTLPITLAILVAAPDLLLLLYGQDWLPSAPFLQVLMLYAVLRPMWLNASNLLAALGKAQVMARNNLIQLVVLASVGALATWLWGALGTSLAVGIALLLSMLFAYRQVVRETSLAFTDIAATPLVAGALTLGGYFLLSHYVDLTDLNVAVRLLVTASYTALAFGAMLFAMEPRALRARLSYIWRLAVQAQ